MIVIVGVRARLEALLQPKAGDLHEQLSGQLSQSWRCEKTAEMRMADQTATKSRKRATKAALAVDHV